jgi:tetratricopeptide (TPR) repeat protein
MGNEQSHRGHARRVEDARDGIDDEPSRSAARPRPQLGLDASARPPAEVTLDDIPESRPSLRPGRPSVRPSAFGPPLASQRPGAPDGEGLEGGWSVPPGARTEKRRAARDLSADDLVSEDLEFTLAPQVPQEEPTPTPTGTRRRVERPVVGSGQPDPLARISFDALAAIVPDAQQNPASFRADLEELLPFVHTKSSVPPTLPALTVRAAPRVQDPRRTRVSLAIFGAMLAASVLPLARYALVKSEPDVLAHPMRATAHPATSQPSPRAIAVDPVSKSVAEPVETEQEEGQVIAGAPVQPLSARAPEGTLRLPMGLPADPMLEALTQVEKDLPADPVVAADLLLAEGLKALAKGDQRFAEALLGRALKRDDDNPRAYFALARIRLSQGNLQGAEGWIVSAIHKRPRRPEYHELYANVLDGLGRSQEARAARERALELRGEL